MENDYLKYQLGAVAQAVSNIDKYSAGIKNSGYFIEWNIETVLHERRIIQPYAAQ